MSDDFAEERGNAAFRELMDRLPRELRWLVAEATVAARKAGERDGAAKAARALA